jgi:uncharacterized protein YrrD
MVISPGMAVNATDGHAGSVVEVVADTDLDVFRGIVVSHGLLSTQRAFVPAEAVAAVTDNAVELTWSKDQISHAPDPRTTTTTGA